MICGTASNVGKSQLVAGICRALARRGLSVAPFKAQNMALNSYATRDGAEIGRAQALQAMAARVEPEAAMNPILLKPTGERSSQVVVMGKPLGHMEAGEYQLEKPTLRRIVLGALEDLMSRFEIVVCEGAGNPAEPNLLQSDLVNLWVAASVGFRSIIVADIDRGGAFASLLGTIELLPSELAQMVCGFVINKFRGDPALLAGAPEELERRCGIPVIGILPFIHGLDLDAEDSLALGGAEVGSGPAQRSVGPAGDTLEVAVVRLPRISNFTDLDALAIEPKVRIAWVRSPAELGDVDLVVLPGSKATVADLSWLRGTGLDLEIERRMRKPQGPALLAICGGYQMLGRLIVDEVESCRGVVEGLGWLPVITEFAQSKITRQRRGWCMGQRVTGYEIRHGAPRLIDEDHLEDGCQMAREPSATFWVQLDDAYGTEHEGAVRVLEASAMQQDVGKTARRYTHQAPNSTIYATSLHGILEEDGFRGAFLTEIARRRGKSWAPSGRSFSAARQDQIDRLADLVESHLGTDRLLEIIGESTMLPEPQR